MVAGGLPASSPGAGPAWSSGARAAGGAELPAFTVVSASTGRLLPDGGPAPVPDPGPSGSAGSPDPASMPGPTPPSGKRLPGCPEGYVCAYTSLKGYRCDRYGKVT